MKNSSTLASRIICSAFFIFTVAPCAYAQENTTQNNTAVISDSEKWLDEDVYIAQLKRDGIPEGVIKTLVAKRRTNILAGRKIVPVKEPVKLFGQNPSVQALCSDMGGETGWGGWTARMGSYGTCAPSLSPTVPTAPRFNLTSGPGTDLCGSPGPTLPVVAPGFGNTSLQIGQPMVNGSSGGCGVGCMEEISYPLFVTSNDTNFTFAYAIVMQNPSGHNNCEQPYVSLCIFDSNGNSIGSCGCFTYVSGPALPGFYTSNTCAATTTYYKPWTLVGINLAAYVGQTLTVVIQNADCSLSGHYAHSYWDFSCGTLSSLYQFCIGEDSVLVTAASTGSGYSYNWSPGGQTTSSIIVNPQLVDTVILTVTPPSGCGFYQVYVLAPTIINTAFSYTVNCNTVTFSDSTTISGGSISSWNWQFPGGTPSSYNGQTPPAISYPVGSYTASLTVTSQAGCTDDTAYISFTLSPPPIISATSASICGSNSGTLCASGGVAYSWNPTNQTTSCILVTTASASTYTIIGTDANGCTGTTTASVGTYMPVITAGPNSSLCANSPSFCPTLTASITGNSPYTYAWSPAGGLSNPNISNPVACPTITTVYTVTGTDGSGCSNTTTVSVTALPGPTVNATSTAAGCTVANGTATANPSGGTTPYTFNWSTSPPQNTQTAVGLAVGNYTVLVTDANGCTGITTVSVSVTPNPVVTAGPASTICFGQTTTVITAQSIPGGVSYIWSPAFGLSCATCQSTIANPTSTNTYFVTVTDVNGCTATASVPVVVGAIPQLSAIASQSVCTGGTAQLNANYSNIPISQLPPTFLWYPPNSPPLSDSSLQNPTITPNTTTNLYVVITDAYGCKDTAYATVYVETIPAVSWTEWTPYITCEGYVIPFFANISDNGSSAYWDFGDNSNLTDYQPAPGGMIWTSSPSPHIYNFSSTYSVSVVAINSICRDTIDTTFTISDQGKYLNVLAANVFTPNGDGINDCFRPALDITNVPNIASPDSLEAALAQCITLVVWDRWGVKMFESTDTEKCWDGTTMKGNPAKQGTYYYIAKFKEAVIPGYVELLR